MGKYIVKSNPMWFIILMILNIIKGEANGGEPHFEVTSPPKELTPIITQTKLEQKSYLFDSFGQHDEIKGVYVLYKPTYERLKSLKSIHIDSLFYASTDGGRSVSLKNLVLEDKPFIVNRVQAVKDHWFCVSISNRSFIYLDKNLQAVHSRHLDEDPFYNPHPLFPEYLIHFVSHYKPDFTKLYTLFISTDYGKNFHFVHDKLKSITWMVTLPILVIHHDNDALQVLDPKKLNTDLLRIDNVHRNFMSGSSILVSALTPDSGLNYFIWDYHTKQTTKWTISEANLEKIHQFIYLHNKYYIVATTVDKRKCLFTNEGNGNFVKVTCDLDPREGLKICPVILHPYIPGYIFANIKKEDQPLVSHISTNNGKDFNPIKVFRQGTNQANVIAFDMHCQDEKAHSFPVPWVTIFTEKYSGSIPNDFVSTDGGLTFTKTPFPIFRMSVINQGGIIMGIDPDSKSFMYSFGSNVWYQTDWLPKTDDIQFFLAHNTKTPSNFVNLLGKKSNREFTTVFNLDFSNVLNRQCQDEDYEIWTPLTEKGVCHEGRKIEFLRIKANTYCIADKTYDQTSIFKPC